MMTTSNRTILAAALIGGLAVTLGAFGAHALDGRVPEARLATFETGARYAMYHALALLAVGLLQGARPSRWLAWSARLFGAGVLLFSGSLFVLVLADLPVMGAVTPLGGVCFISGWVALAISAARHENAPDGTRPPGA